MKEFRPIDLYELKTIIDYTIENLDNKDDAKSIPVRITLSESSMGARAATAIKNANMGFDWEHGQFRIEPYTPLVSKGNALTDIKEVEQMEFGGQKYYGCPRCLQKVAKNDFYCRYCGQKLK